MAVNDARAMPDCKMKTNGKLQRFVVFIILLVLVLVIVIVSA